MAQNPPEASAFTKQFSLPEQLVGKKDIRDVTVNYVKNRYLAGMVLKGQDGKDLPAEFFEHKIEVARDKFEEYTHIFLEPRQVVHEQHDYNAKDYVSWFWTNLRQYPVQTVDEVIAEYPTGKTITVFPTDWFRIRNEHGQLQLVPTSGTLSNILIGRGGSYLGLLRYKLGYLPDLFLITYTAGLEHGQVPASALDIVSKLAVIEILADTSDLIYGPGIQSMSLGLDGLSQSIGITNTGEGGVFTARVTKYLGDLFGRPDRGDKGQLNVLRDLYRGITMAVA